jgi:hypothetical protein
VSTVEQLIEALRTEYELDRRSSVYEVHHVAQRDTATLFGHTTEDQVIAELVRRILELPGVAHVNDEVVRLPGGLPGPERYAVIRSAIAPVYQDPVIPSAQITELVLGSRVDLLSSEGTWWRVRAEDGYIGWVNNGYLAIGTADFTHTWDAVSTVNRCFARCGAGR